MDVGKISIVVPVYNAEAYLEKCLDSIIQQTYENLEIICVDDGSADSSPEILRRKAASDNRVKVILQENGTSARARNAGLDAASGDWITFVDCDDWLESTMYEKLAALERENPAGIIACGYFFDFPDKEVEAVNAYPVPGGIQKTRSFLYYIYCRDDYKGVGSYIWNKLFKSSAVHHLRFDVSLGNLGDDIDWAARCYMLADTIAYLPEALYHHRERPDSAFHAMDQRLENMQHIRAYEKIIALYEENRIEEQVLDYVKRFYVYHLGVLMEYADKTGNREKKKILQEKAQPYLEIYRRTNETRPERICWINGLFGA